MTACLRAGPDIGGVLIGADLPPMLVSMALTTHPRGKVSTAGADGELNALQPLRWGRTRRNPPTNCWSTAESARLMLGGLLRDLLAATNCLNPTGTLEVMSATGHQRRAAVPRWRSRSSGWAWSSTRPAFQGMSPLPRPSECLIWDQI